MSYLKSLYHSRNSGCTIELINAHGGGGAGVLRKATRTLGYDQLLLVFDNDRPLDSSLMPALPTSHAILRLAPELHPDRIPLWCLVTVPCIESFFLLLHSGRLHTGLSTKGCRDAWHSVMPPTDKHRADRYPSILPQRTIEARAPGNEALAFLLRYIGNEIG